MSNLGILLKNNFNILIGRFQGKKQQRSRTVATVLLVVMLVGIFALYTFQAKMMFDGFAPENMTSLAVYHSLIIALSCSVIIGIMRISAKSKTDDSELLLSLPIKKRDIIISKTVNVYLFDLFFDALFLLPYIILNLIYTGFNLYFLLFGLLLVLIMPLMSIGITYICDFIMVRLFNRFKGAALIRSMFSILIYLLVFALLLLKTFTYGTTELATLDEYFADRFFTYMFFKALMYKDIGAIFFVLALTIVPFVIGMLLYSLNYGKTFAGYMPKDGSLKFDSPKSEFGSLIKKELSTYATIPAWIVNTIIGPLFILVFAILGASLGFNKLFGSFGVVLKKEYLVPLCTLFISALVGMTQITCASISLEGKNMWIIKSSPISERKFLTAKALLQVIIVEPVIIIAAIILSIVLKAGFTDILTLLFIPSLLNTFFAFMGVLINLCLPVLDFEDETKVVKSSLSTFLCLALGMVLGFLPLALFMISDSLAMWVVVLITALLYGVLAILSVILLVTVGVKKLRKL